MQIIIYLRSYLQCTSVTQGQTFLIPKEFQEREKTILNLGNDFNQPSSSPCLKPILTPI